MSEAKSVESRPYHHGDLRRALVEAARRLLEAEGPSALSLRAVAREAGVSPAAPYHHFKDKAELLDAVASEGWDMLNESMSAAKDSVEGRQQLTALGIAYVCFARDNPALLFIGLTFSVLFMGLAANYVAKLIERYSWINYIGLAVILWVACNMIYEGYMGGEHVTGLRRVLGLG